MRKLCFAIVALLIFVRPVLHADEGMWLLSLIDELNISKMHELGCKLSADDIYNLNKPGLKDAIVIFGEGCTGEIVSEQGLLLTNHHCGYDAIQYHSTVEHDYLSQGFWAKSREEELPVPDLTVTFLIRMEDVSKQILSSLNDLMSETNRDTAINQLSRKICSDAVAGTHYNAVVQQYYGGNAFYLLVYEKFTDVRMVGAPPSSIGKFGGETDNWMWPRHNCDFSLFRVYTGADGKPAPYSKNNIPLKPRKYLPVSLKGLEKDDFTMVIGYPGGTDRYMTSYGVKELLEIENPARIKVREARQNILMKDMMSDPVVRIKYSDKYSKSANYWKYSIGQNQRLKSLNVLDRKRVQEEKFQEWANNGDSLHKAKYGKVLKMIKDAVESRVQYENAFVYVSEIFFQGTEIIKEGIEYIHLYGILKSEPDSTEKIKKTVGELRKKAKLFFKDYNRDTDKKVTAELLKIFYNNVDESLRPLFFNLITNDFKGDYGKYTEQLFKKSIFADEKKLNDFLDNPKAKILEKDKAFECVVSVASLYIQIKSITNELEDELQRANRLYIAGTLEMNKGQRFYPDANFTMRLSYGKVGDYDPRDAVHYKYYTTLKGILEKEDPSNLEFMVPGKLKELYLNNDFGRYAVNNELHVCFTTNNDITGGNSGSPVLNANGQLIGLAFDGNWEAMSSDIVYEPVFQKTICVDIRYVLFIIDKFAKAKNIVDEMTIVE